MRAVRSPSTGIPAETKRFSIFADASFHPQRRIGVSGFLIIPHAGHTEPALPPAGAVRTRVARGGSNTQLEIETILWALISWQEAHGGSVEDREAAGVTLYTDCQAAKNLLARRSKLEARNYESRRGGGPLEHAGLYRRFFKLLDAIRPQIIWIEGHTRRRQRGAIQEIFAVVDRAVRERLRGI